jgi:phosphoribosylformylglycinamidine (FGAM) synthase PurS component
LFKKFCYKVVAEAVKKTLQELYQNLDIELAKRVRATLHEKYSKIARENLTEMLEQEFLQHESFIKN